MTDEQTVTATTAPPQTLAVLRALLTRTTPEAETPAAVLAEDLAALIAAYTSDHELLETLWELEAQGCGTSPSVTGKSSWKKPSSKTSGSKTASVPPWSGQRFAPRQVGQQRFHLGTL